MRIWATYNQEFEGGGERTDPDDVYSDRTDAHYSWTLGKVSISHPENPYHEMIRCGAIVHGAWVDVETEVGDSLWVVSVIYSTGDTFGTSYGHGTVVCACKDQESAQYIERQINQGEKPEMITSAPWCGYFERVQEVCLEDKKVLK